MSFHVDDHVAGSRSIYTVPPHVYAHISEALAVINQDPATTLAFNSTIWALDQVPLANDRRAKEEAIFDAAYCLATYNYGDLSRPSDVNAVAYLFGMIEDWDKCEDAMDFHEFLLFRTPKTTITPPMIMSLVRETLATVPIKEMYAARRKEELKAREPLANNLPRLIQEKLAACHADLKFLGREIETDFAKLDEHSDKLNGLYFQIALEADKRRAAQKDVQPATCKVLRHADPVPCLSASKEDHATCVSQDDSALSKRRKLFGFMRSTKKPRKVKQQP